MQANTALKITNQIARRTDRIAKWDKEGAEIESSWNGAVAYREFCEAMAGNARRKVAELEAELKQLHGEGPEFKSG